MGVRYSTEKFMGIPIPEDGISFGTISAAGITPYLKINNAIFSGSYGYETITITLKGIGEPPIAQISAANIAQPQFTFRDKTWKVIDTQLGNRFNIAGQWRYNTWTVTGVDTSRPIIKI
jgi:hypothetical protein